MKRFLVLCLMLSVAIAASAEAPNRGYCRVATPSFDIGSGTAVNIGSYVPKGAKGFSLTVYGGDLLMNCQSNLATGSMPVATTVASGSTLTWTELDTDVTATLDIWGIGSSGTVSCRLKAWR